MARMKLILSWCCVLGAAVAASAVPPKDANVFAPNLCFVLTVPGAWFPAEAPGVYRHQDRREAVLVAPVEALDLRKFKGDSLIEKAAASLEKGYRKDYGTLTEVQLKTFDAAMPGTWKWSAVAKKPQHNPLPTVFLTDLSPEGLISITIDALDGKDALARSIIATIKVSKERPCPLPK